jgi:hypothetical protein
VAARVAGFRSEGVRMARGRARIGQRLALLGVASLAGLLVCGAPDTPRSSGDSASPSGKFTPQPIEHILPGTVIGDGPPPGWSHLIIKSHPRPGAGDTQRLTPATAALASFLFTAFVADVRRERGDGPTRYRLHSLAMGLGTNINGKDTILSPDTQARLGARLGLLQRLVLSGAYEMQSQACVVARSPVSAIVDARVRLLRLGKHRPAVLRYALLADERTGSLESLLWLIDLGEGGAFRGPASGVRQLPANCVEDCVLHVDGNEFTLSLPTDNAFAARDLPPARREFSFAEEMKPLAARPRLSPEAFRRLETWLRKRIHEQAH